MNQRMVTRDGRNIWIRTVGSGPAVVFSTGAGVAASSGRLTGVEFRVADFETFVSYDRAGLGHSDAQRSAPDATDMANDSAAVLDDLGFDEPVLLAGLSLGALPIQLFACQNPSAVAGLLLLDPTPDEMMVALSKQPRQAHDLMRLNMARLGASDAAIMECERIIEAGVQVAECIEAHGLPDVPSIVAVAERPASSPLTMLHQDIAGRLSRGRLVR